MRLRIVTIGARAPQWVADGFADYARRMPRHLPLELHELAAPSRKGRPVADCQRQEAVMLRKAAGANSQLIALHEHGRAMRSQQLARRFEGWLAAGRDLALLIGGPDGLDDELLRAADLQWSLGPMTLPHALVRIVVAEQLYRAWSLLEGHPYHRE
ncbi:MAG: 23S rRNA (pseudouridine(1915)-N(3))-methyltransferase RlmH [Wenzhouxiangellaceae bacterium]